MKIYEFLGDKDVQWIVICISCYARDPKHISRSGTKRIEEEKLYFKVFKHAKHYD